MNPQTTLYLIPQAPADWETLKTQVQHFLGEGSCFCYSESLNHCELTDLSWDALTPEWASARWEGRCFNQTGEWRWQREGALYRGWITTDQQLSAGQVAALPANCLQETVSFQERSHYLHGQYAAELVVDAGRYVFCEERFPNKQFVYPLSETPQTGDRAYILVREYLRTEPDWSHVSDCKAFNHLLNQPLLLAHRFVALGATQTPTEKRLQVHA